ncbi:thioesterase family protein [Phaeospirillum tilakii]|uniref:Thioesterase family protein n=1 Tax=Phaeospirillum tilakii TaxID=741673 RepID=A0ABW5CAA8_9PROT
MSLWFRMARVLATTGRRPKLGLLDESELNFRVWPSDLDFNLHMNNARYLAVMDLGRLDLVVRGGLWRAVLRRRWQAVLAGSVVRFRRQLRPFQPFTLKTRLVGWDERWLYLDHRIEGPDGLACHALMRAAFVGPTGVVAPAEVVAEAGWNGTPPPPPAWAGAWRELDRSLEPAAPRAEVAA